MSIAEKQDIAPQPPVSTSPNLVGHQYEQMRALAGSATSVAHLIDQAVSPILLLTDAMMEDATLEPRTRAYLEKLRTAVAEVEEKILHLRRLLPHGVAPERLPSVTIAGATGEHARETARHTARSLRVLLIDDDPSLVESLRSALMDEGHKVTSANGGRAGIEAFREARRAGMPFEIVITDLRMPDVDGHQVIASVRSMSPATPIILLTGWGQHVSNESERPLQVDRLLGKPPRIRELRAALAELTGRRATDRPG